MPIKAVMLSKDIVNELAEWNHVRVLNGLSVMPM